MGFLLCVPLLFYFSDLPHLRMEGMAFPCPYLCRVRHLSIRFGRQGVDDGTNFSDQYTEMSPGIIGGNLVSSVLDGDHYNR